jgi:quercetin dioxygenase-like cupin family protein
MPEIIDQNLPSEAFGVFEVVQITRGTPLEHVVAADLVTIPPRKTSEIHRHNNTESVLLILEGSGTILVGKSSYSVRKGARIIIGKGIFHGVRTGSEALTFLSVQAPPILDRERGVLDLEPMGECVTTGV